MDDNDSRQITLRLTPHGDAASVAWEADVIGRRVSTFHPPYPANLLPLVIRALDAESTPNRGSA